MKYFLLNIIVLFVCTISCSTGPDFERDNINDPNASSVNAKFISQDEYISRGRISNSSFKVKVTPPVVTGDHKLVLSSNINGEIYSTSYFDTDTLIIGRTELSKGVHTISLYLDNKLCDTLEVNVDRTAEVSFKSVNWAVGGYSITWSKFDDINFESYKLFILLEDGKRKDIKTFYDINDTSFTIYKYPFEESFRYGIETTSLDFEKSNQVLSTLITPKYLTTYWPGYFRFPKNLDEIFVRRESEEFNSFNIFTNEVTSSNILGSTYTLTYYIQDYFSTPELIVAKENKIIRYNLETFEYISEIVVPTVNELFFDPNLNLYFGALGNYIINFSAELEQSTYSKTSFNDTLFYDFTIDPKNRLFYASINDWGTERLFKINYNESGEITSTTDTGFLSFRRNGLNRNKLSPSGRYMVAKAMDKRNILFDTSTLEEKLSLIDNITSFYFTNDTLLVGTTTGRLYYYDVTNEFLIGEYNYEHEVSHIFNKRGQVYILIRIENNTSESNFFVVRFIP